MISARLSIKTCSFHTCRVVILFLSVVSGTRKVKCRSAWHSLYNIKSLATSVMMPLNLAFGQFFIYRLSEMGSRL